MSTASRIYQIDKRSAEICSEMQEVGIEFDVERAALFAEILREKEAEAILAAEKVLNRQLKRTKGGGVEDKDLKHAFFKELGVPAFFLSATTQRPSLDAKALQAYARSHDEKLKRLALAEISRRKAVKIRSTYLTKQVSQLRNGRIHPSWNNFGTVGGRWSCSNPNLANLPGRNDPLLSYPTGEKYRGIRSLYRASAGNCYVYYDKSQIEFRVASYASGDEAMIAACEGGDVHSGNAVAVFGDAFNRAVYEELKATEAKSSEQLAVWNTLSNLRTLAKSAIFAVCYMAEAETVYDTITSSGVETTLRRVQAMLMSLKRRFRHYYMWQDDNLLNAVKTSVVTTPINGRVRWVGHAPSPTEVANFPIQGGAADVMNAELWALRQRLRDAAPSARFVAHVYDSVLIEVLEREHQRVIDVVKDVSLAPISLNGRNPVLPIDLSVSDRWH